jgi:hypothetical protein
MIEAPFERAGLSLSWAHEFVVESNQIDPQPGENAPGSPLYDLHYAALAHVVATSLEDRYALPRDLHSMLLPGHPLAGVSRSQPITIGFRKMLHPRRVAHFTWRWNADVRETIGELRSRPCTWDERQDLIWDLHCELMNIRPFEIYNGRVGRLLLANHAILLGIEPALIRSDSREDYLARIRSHPSAAWVDEPRYRPSARRYRE